MNTPMTWLGCNAKLIDGQSELTANSAANAEPKAGTPAATWRAEGKPDPHGNDYDLERADLCMGNLTMTYRTLFRRAALRLCT